ncbi:MAG: hypothetical protein M1549_03885 [Candidatus Dependentiae bacterium]|nr:hypothetical protein [Candidatus Dependentiae bacterium]
MRSSVSMLYLTSAVAGVCLGLTAAAGFDLLCDYGPDAWNKYSESIKKSPLFPRNYKEVNFDREGPPAYRWCPRDKAMVTMKFGHDVTTEGKKNIFGYHLTEKETQKKPRIRLFKNGKMCTNCGNCPHNRLSHNEIPCTEYKPSDTIQMPSAEEIKAKLSKRGGVYKDFVEKTDFARMAAGKMPVHSALIPFYCACDDYEKLCYKNGWRDKYHSPTEDLIPWQIFGLLLPDNPYAVEQIHLQHLEGSGSTKQLMDKLRPATPEALLAKLSNKKKE